MDPNSRSTGVPNQKTASQPFYPGKSLVSKFPQNVPNPNESEKSEEFPPGIQPPVYFGNFHYLHGDGQHKIPTSHPQHSRFETASKNVRSDDEFRTPNQPLSFHSSKAHPGMRYTQDPETSDLSFLSRQSFDQKLQDRFVNKPSYSQDTSSNLNLSNSLEPGYRDVSNSFLNPAFMGSFSTETSSNVAKPIFQNAREGLFVPVENKSVLIEEAKSGSSPAEDIMSAINQNQINCVSLLNEVGSKVKKRVDYVIKEVPVGKIKIFECNCVLDKDKIGFGKGNSKQGAKTESAIEGVRTLLTKDQFTYEKAHITLSVQKTTGIGINPSGAPSSTTTTRPDQTQPQIQIQAQVLVNSNVQENASKPQEQQDTKVESQNQSVLSQSNLETEAGLMNDSALYELNLIAKECFIEPRWVMSPPGGPNGEFEAQVIFDKLVANGKGRKKLDAKRDAAFKIIQQIRGSKELKERYNPKSKKKLSPSNSMTELAKNDQRKILFESCVDPKILQEIESNEHTWKETIMKLEKNLSEYLTNVRRKYEVEEETSDILHEFFNAIADYTNIVTSNPKQIMLEEPKHLADYLHEVSLVPAGSFALDCMRDDKLSIDALLTFEEIKKISEKELLELYHAAMTECQKLALRENPSSALKMEFSIETSDEFGNFLLVKTNSMAGELTMQIQISNLCLSSGDSSVKKYDNSVVHIQRIYDCFEDSDRLKQFRDLMCLMRIWRSNNENVILLAPELLDAVLLADFLSNKNGNLATYVINCLTVMSTEEAFKAALSRCGDFYTKLYKEIPSKMKWAIASQSSQSLEAIYKEQFEECSIV